MGTKDSFGKEVKLTPRVKQLALWRQEQRWKETGECREKGTELIKMGAGGEEIMKMN